MNCTWVKYKIEIKNDLGFQKNIDSHMRMFHADTHTELHDTVANAWASKKATHIFTGQRIF